MIDIAIVGYGFVGKAVSHGFNRENVRQTIIDPYHPMGQDISVLKDKNIKATFICVPTPMGENGVIDANIVEDVMEYLNENVSGLKILKSTVIPDIIAKFANDEKFVYNPEFLTERNANDDFINGIMHIFGCSNEDVANEMQVLYHNYSNCNIAMPMHVMTPIEASLVKYGINSFLATKVAWFNQFYDLVNQYGSDYDHIINAIGCDSRVSASHTKVPGPDGQRGFSGACFPKDTAAIYSAAKKNNIELSILKEAIIYNQVLKNNDQIDARANEQNVSFNLEL